MSVIGNVPKWQIELWDNIFEKMRGPYHSLQNTLMSFPEFTANEKKQQKSKVDATIQWIQQNCSSCQIDGKNMSFEKIFQIALEAIAKTAICHEYDDTLAFQRFFGKSPFKEIEDEAKTERSVEPLEIETSQRIRILSIWKERPDLFLKTDYSAAKESKTAPFS